MADFDYFNVSRYFNSSEQIYLESLNRLKLLNENFISNNNASKKLESLINKGNGPIGRKINEDSYIKFMLTKGVSNLNFKEARLIEPNEVFKICARNLNHKFYILYLYSALKKICMTYFYNNRYEKAHAFGLIESDYHLWKDARCTNYLEELKSISDINLMLEKFKPNYIMLSSTIGCAFNGPNEIFETQFGILLFDEFGNILTKAVFQFYDEGIAPKNALALDMGNILRSFTSPSMINPPFLIPEDI
ncbi:hypothetical protein NRA67_04335 [Acinetobacter baumannii]|nr:hypothetical protein [Acinetobacter baumannii]